MHGLRALVVTLVACGSVSAFALAVPARPNTHVNDYAGVLGSETQVLEDQLTGYGVGTSAQYVVAVFPSLEGEALEDFSIRLAEAWKVGGKKQSDGVLVSVFMQERKVRIEVGYGLEGTLTDAFCAELIRDVIGPAAAKGQLGAGLSEAFAQIDAKATGRQNVAPVHARPRGAGQDSGKLGGLVLFGFVVLVVLIVSNRRGGGGGGSGVGPFLGGWILGGGGWGGGRGSSDWGGGGSFGGGGFSGGGGSFGGGGASGGW